MQADRIGKYRIDGVLGSGAMGIVYRGFDPDVGRAVAIKTVRKELLAAGHPWNAIERFRREARAAGRLAHPNIVTVHEFGEDECRAYLVCEYVAGVSLDVWLDEHGRADLAQALGWMHQLLAALEFAHAHGVVHRDIKAGNLLVVRGRHIKLADFGIAQLDSADLTRGGMMLGTPSSMAPEQIQGGPVDGRADVFACGVLLYALLTGRRPFNGGAEAAMRQILTESPPAPSQVDAALPAVFDAVVARALARAPAERHQTPGEFLSALRQAAAAANLSAAVGGFDADATLFVPPCAPHEPATTVAVHSTGGWSGQTLALLEASLRPHVGPIARVLVGKAAGQTASLAELVDRLAGSLRSDAARSEFLAAHSDIVAAAPKAPRRTHLGARRGTAPHPGLDEASVARVRERLTVLIGPMASVAIRRALNEAGSLRELVERAAAEVPEAGSRRRFLGEFGVSAR